MYTWLDHGPEVWLHGVGDTGKGPNLRSGLVVTILHYIANHTKLIPRQYNTILSYIQQYNTRWYTCALHMSMCMILRWNQETFLWSAAVNKHVVTRLVKQRSGTTADGRLRSWSGCLCFSFGWRGTWWSSSFEWVRIVRQASKSPNVCH